MTRHVFSIIFIMFLLSPRLHQLSVGFASVSIDLGKAVLRRSQVLEGQTLRRDVLCVQLFDPAREDSGGVAWCVVARIESVG